MKITKTDFKDLLIIEHDVYIDDRGLFKEVFRNDILEENLGYKINFCQDNQVKSFYMALRGLHYQEEPYAQSKLVSASEGKILDVVVDRNAYGRQIMSSKESISFNLNNQTMCVDATLIRAPKIISSGNSVNIIAKIGDYPVAVIQGKHIGLSFHPELDGVTIFHEILYDSSSNFFGMNLEKIDAA